MKLTEQIMAVADRYCEAVDLSRSYVSQQVFNDGKRLDRIANGSAIRSDVFEGAMQWWSDRWPPKTSWPAGVARPPRTKAEVS